MTETSERELKSYAIIYALLLAIMLTALIITYHFKDLNIMATICFIYGTISSILLASKLSKWIG